MAEVLALEQWEADGSLVVTRRMADGSGGDLVAQCAKHRESRNADAVVMAAALEMRILLQRLVADAAAQEGPLTIDSNLPVVFSAAGLLSRIAKAIEEATR